jgi:hypothetical protein
MSTGPTKKRDEIYKLIEDTEKQGEEIEQIGHRTAESGRLLRDFADAAREVISNVPNDDMLPEEEWQRLEDAFGIVKSAGEPMLNIGPALLNYTTTVSATGLTTNSMIYAIGPIAPPLAPVVDRVKVQINTIMEARPLMQDVEASIKRLGLNDLECGDQRTAVQLLRDSKLALDRPATPSANEPIPVLIPLRQCVLAILGELWRRTNSQEKLSGDKHKARIVALGKYCGLASIQSSVFEVLGSQWSALFTRLSDTKDATMPRSEISREFNNGILFLQAFLDTIDETKLKP